LFSVAPCGTIFLNNKPGVISTVERNIFNKRLDIKKLMRESEGGKRDRYFSFQWALKILLNAVFGATSVPYSRYFNIDIAEAITSCGRHTIKSGENYTNEVLNTPDTVHEASRLRSSIPAGTERDGMVKSAISSSVFCFQLILPVIRF